MARATFGEKEKVGLGGHGKGCKNAKSQMQIFVLGMLSTRNQEEAAMLDLDCVGLRLFATLQLRHFFTFTLAAF